MTIHKPEYIPCAGDFVTTSDMETFYIAPKPVPTGIQPIPSRPLHRTANEIYLDFAIDALGLEMAARWFIGWITAPVFIFLLISLGLGFTSYYTDGQPVLKTAISFLLPNWVFWSVTGFLSCLYGALFLSLAYPVARHRPLRFNRQRREVAYAAKRGKAPCIVPWEEVIAGVACIKTTTEHGTQDSFVLKIGLRDESDETIWITIPAENQAFALAEWEAIRVYMEEGPDALPVPFMAGMSDIGTVAYFHECRRDYRKFRGWFCYLFGFLPIHLCSGWTLPNHLAEWIERLPGTSFPKAIREWSKPLPREQWATPSIELLEESKAMKRSFRKGTGLFQYFQEKTRQP
jgi:hypothetical protein